MQRNPSDGAPAPPEASARRRRPPRPATWFRGCGRRVHRIHHAPWYIDIPDRRRRDPSLRRHRDACPGISITTVGLILMIVGIVGLVLSLLYMIAWAPRRGVPARPRGRTRHLPRAAGPLARGPGVCSERRLARRYAQPVSDPTASAGLLIDAARLADWMAAEPGLQVIDVREPHEREAGHIAGTRHIELNRAHRRGGEHRPRPSRRLLLPRRRPLRDGGRSLPRGRLRGILPGRRPGALGRAGPAALARGRHRGRPLERRPRWRLRPTSRKSRSGDGWATGEPRRPGRRSGLSQGPQGARRDRLRRQRDRPAAGHRDRLPLPRRAGGALLRAPRRDRDRVRRRLGADARRGRPSPVSTPPRRGRSATPARSRPST